jgi:hypothetical protein
LTEQSARDRLREWIRGQIDGQHAVKLPDIATLGVEHFMNDTAFLRALFGEQLRSLIYAQAQTVFKQTRPAAIQLGDEIVDQEEMAKRAERVNARWSKWLEHAGQQHVQLLQMDRIQLLTAAAERESRADVEFKRATFLRELADGLRGRKKVGEVFKMEEIEAVWNRVHGANNKELGKAA